MNLPFPIPEFLEKNPYFQAGFGIAILGVASQVLRTGSLGISLLAKRQLLVTMEVTSKDPAFPWVLRWLNANAKGLARRLSLQTLRKAAASGKSLTSFDFVPAIGNHFIKYKNRWMFVERQRETEARDLQTGTPWETLKFTTVGRCPSIYNHLMLDAKRLADERNEEYTVIYQSMGHHGWQPFGPPRRKRPLSSVILDEGVMNAILDDISIFLTSMEWYRERGIPYRRGYLLHGSPGSGKSSFVMALAGHLGYDICTLNMAIQGLSDDHLMLSLMTLPERSLVLLEDIDAAFVDRKTVNSNQINITFSGLLNALDGVTAGEERIIIMTTNHLRRLDAALIRPGRVDVIHKLDVASKYQIAEMFQTFYPEAGARKNEFADAIAGHGVSMAELQSYFMLNREAAEYALEDVELFLTSLKAGRNSRGKDLSMEILDEAPNA